MKRLTSTVLQLTAGLLMAGLLSTPVLADRWYTDRQVMEGKPLFIKHCAGCHGADAASTPAWRKQNADGSFPPPPLNGTAHTWHHPIHQLHRTIRKGGAAIGGRMPAFEKQLSIHEINSIIAWFQSLWPDEVYQAWERSHYINNNKW